MEKTLVKWTLALVHMFDDLVISWKIENNSTAASAFVLNP